MRKQRRTMLGVIIGLLLLGSTLVVVINNRLDLAKEAKVMAGLEGLLAKDDLTVTEVLKYLEEKVNTVSAENARHLLLGLERVQQDNLAKWQKRYEDSALQEKMAEIYQINWSLEDLSNTTDQELKEVLIETRENGFKVETAEGLFFPVIDYTFYRRYHHALPTDLVAYLELMAVESEKTPVKDAALIIGWEEILSRAENQEQFIKEYQTSTQVEPVRQLLKSYLTFALFGCNNTPLFSYDTKQMNSEAREVYTEYIRTRKEGEFFTLLMEFVNLLEEHDYRLSKEVESFRRNAVATW